jgi:hypothetical protein
MGEKEDGSMSDLLIIKKEVIQTMATRGWRFITDRADAVIKDLTDKALDEDNKEKRDQLVTEARAARKFWQQLSQSLEASKTAEAEPTADAEEWNEVSM